MSPCPLLPTRSAFPEAEQTDLRAEEPHLRLRHGLHHKCHADRGQPDPSERHGVAAPAASQLTRTCMLRGRTSSTVRTVQPWTVQPRTQGCVVQPVLQTHFIS